MQPSIKAFVKIRKNCGPGFLPTQGAVGAGARMVSLLCIFFLGNVSAQTPGPKSLETTAHMQQAHAALKAKNIQTAAKEFGAVLALDPRNVEANVNLGVITFSQGDYQACSQHLRKALAVRPSIPQAQALLGICEKRIGNSSAKSLLETSFLKLTDTQLRTQVGMELIGLYHSQGDSERAIPVVQKLVELNPEDANILYVAQRLYRELADDTLNKLAVVAPGSARMQQAIAQRLVNEGDLNGAIEHYRKALAIDPRIPGVHYELGEAIFEASPGDASAQTEAEKELETAIAQDGDSATIQCELGKIALARAEIEKAQAHYTRAYTLDDGDPHAQLGMGQVLLTMSKPTEARKYLEMAVKSDPLNEAGHYRLFLAYQRLQMRDEAQREKHLFDEIKKTKDQVEELYKQMNLKPQTSDKISESDKQ